MPDIMWNQRKGNTEGRDAKWHSLTLVSDDEDLKEQLTRKRGLSERRWNWQHLFNGWKLHTGVGWDKDFWLI